MRLLKKSGKRVIDMSEQDGQTSPEAQDENQSISRRKLLASAGIAGAAFLASGLYTRANGGTVSQAVYGSETCCVNDVKALYSVADLTGFEGEYDGRQAHVVSYHPDQEVGGGLFYFDSSRPKSEHNGGTVISWTVPWDGQQAALANFLDGVGETDPSGTGCWIRPFDGRGVYAEWFGVVGDNGDETPGLLKAKQLVDTAPNRYLYLPARLVTVTLDEPLIFANDGSGMFGTGADPYIYSENEQNVSGLKIFGGPVGENHRAAIVFDGKGQCGGNFILVPGADPILTPSLKGWYWPLDTCTYSGEFSRIRTRRFEGSHRLYNSVTFPTQEANHNKFEMIECYGIEKGLLLGVNPVPGATQVAFNENTWIGCRYRGRIHCLYMYRNSTPKAYGNVFINCIFQENPMPGTGDFEMFKADGGQVEGVTFINGRFESAGASNRQRPVINLNGLSSRGLCNFIGTYITVAITIIDDNNIMRTMGTVKNTNWVTKDLEMNSLIARGTTEMKNSLNPSNAIRWTGKGDTTTPTRQWLETPNIADGYTSAGYGGKFRKGTSWSENLIEFASSTGGVRETKMWVDGVAVTRTMLAGSNKYFVPASDADIQLGAADARWSELYAATNVINTSDRNEKQDIEEIPDAVLDAWGDIQYRKFRFKDAVAKKGNEARLHIGLVAQEIEEVFANHGLDALAYGLLCKDVVPDGNGGTREMYSIRPDECQFLELAYIRRELRPGGRSNKK